MPRLILEYSDSDGCTYSCTVTSGIIHDSPQSALDELNLILIEHDLNYTKHHAEYERLSKIQYDVSDKMNSLSEAKKKDEKKIEELRDKYMEAYEKSSEYYKKHLSVTEFKFGGQSFMYDSFFYTTDNGDKEISLPQIFTLDDYFQDAEKNIKENK